MARPNRSMGHGPHGHPFIGDGNAALVEMTASSNAKAGGFGIGASDLDAAWETLAGEIARAHAAGDSQPPGAAIRRPVGAFGPWETEAEAALYAYLDRLSKPHAATFRPFQTLSARLAEFDRQASDNPEPALRAPSPQAPSQSGSLEEKFAELRQTLLRTAEENGEIVAVNARLAEIVDRMERLAARLPGEHTIAALEKELAALTRSLDTAREQCNAQTLRVSRAAGGINEVAQALEATRRSFEAKAAEQLAGFERTAAVAAGRAASLAVRRVTTALDRSNPRNRLSRLEGELRALNSASQAEAARTSASLDRIHNLLRDFLEGGAATPVPQPQAESKRRIGLHTPIAAGAPPVLRGGGKWPPPNAPRAGNKPVENEIETASLRAGSARGKWRAHGDERSFPLGGLAAMAVVLLLASAALYYLHTHGGSHAPPVLSLATKSAKEPSPAHRLAQANALLSPPAVMAPKPPASGLPSLFTDTAPMAGDGTHSSEPASDPAEAAVDIEKLMRAASAGDKDAQYRVGLRFLKDAPPSGGNGAAARWLGKAAAQGQVEAEFLLASLFERGIGVVRDEARAIGWYRQAAQAGNARAMHNLGVLLVDQGTPESYREAAQWFERAARAGITGSQVNLAILEERGLGLPKNDEKAYFWYSVAAFAGDDGAKREAARLYLALPEDESAEMRRRAASWRPEPRLKGGGAPALDWDYVIVAANTLGP